MADQLSPISSVPAPLSVKRDSANVCASGAGFWAMTSEQIQAAEDRVQEAKDRVLEAKDRAKAAKQRVWAAEKQDWAANGQFGDENTAMELGEIKDEKNNDVKIKDEDIEDEGVHSSTSNLFVKHENRNMSKSPFAHASTDATVDVNPSFSQSRPAGSGSGSRPTTITQSRNRVQVNGIDLRLKNFHGPIDQLAPLANVQQQLDAAFAALDRAKSQLRDILRQFENQGHMSKRQNQKRYGATRNLSQASQRIAQLTQELWNIQRCEPGRFGSARGESIHIGEEEQGMRMNIYM
ncbi:hypothetical protein F4678DRAFT_240320 [Xylaria arbuscula]|nr:hypothetical protein F4678DRAFT_240320 [Xylaria arbuscula]